MSESRFDQLVQKLDQLGTRIDGTNDMIRAFIREQSVANRQSKASLSHHEGRIRDLERRRKER